MVVEHQAAIPILEPKRERVEHTDTKLGFRIKKETESRYKIITAFGRRVTRNVRPARTRAAGGRRPAFAAKCR